MKTLHCLIAGLRPASSNVATRIAISSLVIGGALAFVQPCAGLSFQFQETGSMATARAGPSATSLRNGQVLVAAGVGLDLARLTSAELYDPRTATWTPTGSLSTARNSHTATLLGDGRVLVAGGENFNSGILSSAEL